MSDVLEQRAAVPRATTRRSRHISVIWIIPLLAVAIGAWLAWDTWSKEGPTIRISFDSGEGLQAGQSQLKFKDIVFGTVKSLELAPDHTHVVVTVATTHQAKPLLTEKTIFWVVKPRLFAGNVSGLETLLSGSYIGMLPGEAGGKAQHEFVGQEDPPILQANVPGHTFILKAKKLGSISLGSPVFFRDLNVGEVLGWDIADMAEYVTIRAFVRAPYDSYVHDETRFWNASGVSVKLAGAGVEVQMESLKALLLGGIAFETPKAEIHAAVTAENHVFPLFADRDAANNASYTRKIPVISYFPGSVKGLAPGSEVTMHGLAGRSRHRCAARIRYGQGHGRCTGPLRGRAGTHRRRRGPGVQDRRGIGRSAPQRRAAGELAECEPDHRAAEWWRSTLCRTRLRRRSRWRAKISCCRRRRAADSPGWHPRRTICSARSTRSRLTRSARASTGS